MTSKLIVFILFPFNLPLKLVVTINHRNLKSVTDVGYDPLTFL